VHIQTIKAQRSGWHSAFTSGGKKTVEEVPRVGTFTLLVEPIDEVGRNLFEFFGKTDQVKIDLESLRRRGTDYEELVRGIEELCEYYADAYGVSLVDFLIALAWLKLAEKVRQQSVEHEATGSLRSSGKEFTRNLHELRNIVTFHYKELVLSNLPPAADCNFKNPEWLKFISKLLGFSSGLEQDQTAYVANRTVELTPYTYFTLNRGLYLMDVKDHPESQFIRGRLDYSEWGHRWGVSWAVLMCVMLCQLAQTFILYNEEVEKHVSERKEARELRDLTHAAFQDFAPYYDIDIIQSHLYKEEFETAKKTFGRNRSRKCRVQPTPAMVNCCYRRVNNSHRSSRSTLEIYLKTTPNLLTL
jgi:hypothetical protein